MKIPISPTSKFCGAMHITIGEEEINNLLADQKITEAESPAWRAVIAARQTTDYHLMCELMIASGYIMGLTEVAKEKGTDIWHIDFGIRHKTDAEYVAMHGDFYL